MKSYRLWGSVILIVSLVVWAIVLASPQQSEDSVGGEEQSVEVSQ